MDLLTPDFGVFFWQSIILFVVLFILGKFAWKPALSMIKTRENFIKDSLDRADECNKRVAKIENECFDIIKGANLEKNKILQSALEDKKKIVKEAEVDAKKISDKIVNEIEQSIKEYHQEAIKKSQKDILTLSIDIAEHLIGKELKEENKNFEFIQLLIDAELRRQTNTSKNEAL